MNPKPQTSRALYIESLRRMTGEQRLLKAFELTEMCRAVFKDGLRHQHPGLPEEEIEILFRERVDRCRNKHY